LDEKTGQGRTLNHSAGACIAQAFGHDALACANINAHPTLGFSMEMTNDFPA
jgi:hypothetical protein